MSLNELNRRQSACKTKLQKTKLFVEEFKYAEEKKDVIQLNSKVKSVEDCLKEIEHLKNKYCALPEKVDLGDSLDTLSDLEEVAENAKVSLLCYLSKFEKFENEAAVVSTKNFIKLPDIPLPTFTGNFQEFHNFKTHFMNLIGNNDALPDSQKLVYLKGCLKNDAALIQSEQDTFDSLLNALEMRYENKRALVDIHISKILSLNKINSENPVQIRFLIDSVRNHIRSLKNLNLDSNSLSDAIIFHVLQNKVDQESQRLFQLGLKTNEVPNLTDFLSFLDLRCIQLESVITADISTKNISLKNKITSGVNSPSRFKSFLTRDNAKNPPPRSCVICHKSQLGKGHAIYNCEEFLKHTPAERYDLCKRHNICINCLNFHPHKNCFSPSRCRICNSFHNTKLHRDRKDDSPLTLGKEETESEQCFSLHSPTVVGRQPLKFLLSTAVVLAEGFEIRTILDSASEINLITNECAINLGLKRERINSSVSGINGLSQDIKYKTRATISNKENTFNKCLDFFIVPKICSDTPSCKLDISEISIPKNIKLADPSFYKPSQISMLLGAQVFFKIIKSKQINLNDSITLQNSVFNFIVTGSLPTIDKKFHCFLLCMNECLETLAATAVKDDISINCRINGATEINSNKRSSSCAKLNSNSDGLEEDVAVSVPAENNTNEIRKTTERVVLSTIENVFKPTVLLSPVTTKAKHATKELWRLKLDWSQPPPTQLENSKIQDVAILHSIYNLKIPRLEFLENSLSLNLQGFSYASEKGQRATVYNIQDSSLRLCGSSFHLHKGINPSPTNFSNVLVEKFKIFPLEFLPVCLMVLNAAMLVIINKCSSFHQIQAVIVWCVYFIKIPLEKFKGNLISRELTNALLCAVKKVQSIYDVKEIYLKGGQKLRNSSHSFIYVIIFSPFVDYQDVFHLRNRLKLSNLPMRENREKFLPNDNHISELLINHYYVFYIHTGVEATLNNIKVLKIGISCLKVSATGSNLITVDLHNTDSKHLYCKCIFKRWN